MRVAAVIDRPHPESGERPYIAVVTMPTIRSAKALISLTLGKESILFIGEEENVREFCRKNMTERTQSGSGATDPSPNPSSQ